MQPYSSLAVRKLTRTLAIGKRDGSFMRVREDLLGGCTGNWLEDWDKFEVYDSAGYLDSGMSLVVRDTQQDNRMVAFLSI